MRGLRVWALPALCLALIVSGCAERDLSKPPKIGYGRDLCAECRMIIQDERFAAAIVTPEGTVFKFDDIGCMQHFQNKNTMPGSRVWVHDFKSVQWVDAQNADLVKSDDLITPMGYGIAAHDRRKSQ